jgi:putative ABC transport system substrate-binding protein
MTLAGGILLLLRPRLSSAQQPARRIAYLGTSGADTMDPKYLEGFRRGLAENGLGDGRTISVSYLFANGDPERLRQLANELAKAAVDVIVTAGPQPVRALVAAKVRAPVVFAILADPVGDRIVESLARPGGTMTGLSMANSELERKRIEILKDAVPSLRRLMILHDRTMGPGGLDEAVSAAAALGVEATILETTTADEYERVFDQAAAQGCDGVSGMASPFYNFDRKRLIDLAARHRLASIWETSVYVRDGGLLCYGPDFADMYRRAGGYVAKILAGAKPADLPVEQPLKFELAVNLRTAKALGLSIPPVLLARADEVIE